MFDNNLGDKLFRNTNQNHEAQRSNTSEQDLSRVIKSAAADNFDNYLLMLDPASAPLHGETQVDNFDGNDGSMIAPVSYVRIE